MIHDLGMVFMVFYAVASCGLVLLNLINIKHTESINFALMQGVISLVVLWIFSASSYVHVYNLVAIVSCWTSVIIAIFGGSEE